MASRPTPPKKPSPATAIGWAAILFLFGFALIAVWLFSAPKAIDYSDLWKLIEKNRVEKVTFVGEHRLEGELKESEIDSEEAKAAGLKKKKEFQVEIVKDNNKDLWKLLNDHGVKTG